MARITPLCSRYIVGWHLDDHMEESLVVPAFRRAEQHRNPAFGLIVHSDGGGHGAARAVWLKQLPQASGGQISPEHDAQGPPHITTMLMRSRCIQGLNRN